MPSTLFYLGAPEPRWLEKTDVSLFVSRRRLHRLGKKWPRALAPWAIDSGGYMALSTNGEWDVTPPEYIAEVRRASEEIGNVRWAAIQDFMCEAIVLAKTGLSIAEHQRRTVDSLLELRTLAPDLPWTPVLQGWERDDYLRCADLYSKAGIDLAKEPIVGLGSVCRRHATSEAEWIVDSLRRRGLTNLHGFGFKSDGLRNLWGTLASADSMAWSYRARKEKGPMPGHTHQKCANCLPYALKWREELLASCESPDRLLRQRFLPF